MIMDVLWKKISYNGQMIGAGMVESNEHDQG